MSKKELNRLFHLNQEINELLADIQEAELKAGKVTGSLDDMPHASGVSDKVGDNAAIIADLKALRDEKLDQVKIEQGELLKKIYLLEDACLRRVLRERYVNLKSFEEISVMLKYSYRNTLRLHGRALAEYGKMA